jgi:hypothetical protein
MWSATWRARRRRGTGALASSGPGSLRARLLTT